MRGVGPKTDKEPMARPWERIGTATELAPAMYPEIHYLTSPLRGEANDAGDAEYLNLWAGTGFAQCSEASAAEIVNDLGSA